MNSRGFTHLIALVLTIVSVAAIGTYMLVASHASTKYTRIVDVSWPQCGRKITAEQGLVGVNNGRPRTHNPCMRKQVQRMDNYALYVNTAYSGKRYMPKNAACTSNVASCWAYNKGVSDALYSIAYANKIDNKLYAGQWWIDVEKDSSGDNTGNKWSGNTDLNVEYLKGMMTALGYGNITVGFYSNPSSWDVVTGDWQNNHPSWLALGVEAPNNEYTALQNCDHSFTGGSLWFVQYILHKDQPGKDLDINYACHSTARKSFLQ